MTASSGQPKTLTKSTVVAGVQEHNGVLGDPKAPVTITEYVDLQCPICKEASTTELPTLVDNYVKTGKVKLQLRTLHFIGDDSTTAAKVAAGAQHQGKLWSFLETFYANQGEENSGYVTDDFLKGVAAAAGVDATKAMDYAKTERRPGRAGQGRRATPRRSARTRRRRSRSSRATARRRSSWSARPACRRRSTRR